MRRDIVQLYVILQRILSFSASNYKGLAAYKAMFCFYSRR